MVRKGARKLRKKSVRNLLTLVHYRFKLFLKHEAFEYGKTVIDVCEACISKTVSWTGQIIHNVGGAQRDSARRDGPAHESGHQLARGILLP